MTKFKNFNREMILFSKKKRKKEKRNNNIFHDQNGVDISID
jgi:hypothetical protein